MISLHYFCAQIRDAVGSHRVSDAAIKGAMKRTWEENQYLICPHSATAVDYHYRCTDLMMAPTSTGLSAIDVCDKTTDADNKCVKTFDFVMLNVLAL